MQQLSESEIKGYVDRRDLIVNHTFIDRKHSTPSDLFRKTSKVTKVPSYGLSGNFYDARISDRVEDFFVVGAKGTGDAPETIRLYEEDDKKYPYCSRVGTSSFDLSKGMLIVPPNLFFIAWTIEHFAMPNDVIGIMHPKSAISRSGLQVEGGTLHQGFNGRILLEIRNPTNNIIHLPLGSGISTIAFYKTVKVEDEHVNYDKFGQGYSIPRLL